MYGQQQLSSHAWCYCGRQRHPLVELLTACALAPGNLAIFTAIRRAMQFLTFLTLAPGSKRLSNKLNRGTAEEICA